jgi:glycosyltransferase involved in cell wall biosynthesis
MKLSVIIPLYNEQENLIELHRNLMQVMEKYDYNFELILVDDGSRDQTAKVMTQLATENPRIKCIFFRRNFGQTPALMAGFDFATGDILIPMDGDNQNDPADIPQLIEKLNQGYDVVSGWRKNRKDKAITRVLPSKLANYFISKIGKVSLHDYGCTLKAYRSDIIKPVLLYGEMHRFIPIFAKWQGAKVTEMVVNHHHRKFGKTNYGLNRTFKVLLDLIFIVYMERYFKKPIYLFGTVGILNIGFSFFLFLTMLYLKFFGGKSFIETPLPMLFTLFFLVGILSLFFGLIAEVQMRTYFESQKKTTYAVKSTLNF